MDQTAERLKQVTRYLNDKAEELPGEGVSLASYLIARSDMDDEVFKRFVAEMAVGMLIAQATNSSDLLTTLAACYHAGFAAGFLVAKPELMEV